MEKIVRSSNHIRYIFTDDEKNHIKNLFIDKGYSMRKISSEYGCNPSVVGRILDEFGIDHSRGNLSSFKYNYPDGIYDENEERCVKSLIDQIPSKKQKYDINDHYFDDLRNPEAIYTIGFLYADGCNHDKLLVTLSLEEKDVEILQVINSNMKNEKPVTFHDKSNKHDFGYDYENQYQVAIYNKRIATVLDILGVVPKKSLILEFPKWLHPSMYSHFIRGVFDGDGSIYRYFDKTGKPRNTTLTITSTEQFCKAIVDISAKYIGINSNIYDASCHNGITRVYSITGYNICKKFLDWMYKDSTIHMRRKYDRYIDYYYVDKSASA